MGDGGGGLDVTDKMGDNIYDKIRGDITDIMGDNKSDVRGVG